MLQNKITILSTRPLERTIIEAAKRKSIIIETLSFIETEAIDTVEVQEEIEHSFLQSSVVVFTSMNAIEAVGARLDDQQPDWLIYTMGHSSQELVKEYFGEDLLAGVADSAAELADLILQETDAEEILFFCGDQRRDELPNMLRSNDIEVTEIEVYNTIATPHKLNKHYQGILFFSPSAVRSFFSANKSEPETIFFAIGDTTANEIKKFTNNKIIVGDAPGKENLVKEAVEFFES